MWKCEAIVLASRIALCSKAATATAGGIFAGRGNQLPLGRPRELSGTQRVSSFLEFNGRRLRIARINQGERVLCQIPERKPQR